MRGDQQRLRARPTPPRPPRPRRPRRPARLLRLGEPSRRLHALLVVAAVVLSLCGGRILQLQAVDASSYALAATRELTRTVTLPAARGAILDTHGVPLATTVEAVNVTVDQTLVKDPAATAAVLAPLLGMDVADVRERITGDKRFAYVKRDVSPDVWRDIKAASIVGVFSEPAPRRVYPAEAVAGNVVGFVGVADQGGVRKDQGRAGIEMAYQDVLAGRDGKVTYERGAGERRLPLSDTSNVDPTTGRSVRLTIDRDIQWYAQQVLADKVRESRAVSGSAVVLDAQTGEVLAMATAPSVDPNDPGASDRSDRGNRVVEESYEPGSVQKVLTAAALVEERAVDRRTVFTVPDSIYRSGHTISDHEPHPTTRMTFAGIIAESSNVGTILASERISKQKLRSYLVKFGLGQKPGTGLPGETGGRLPDDWSNLTRDTIAFGQGLSVSILQIASAYATIANDGVRVPVRLVDALVDEDGTVHELPHGAPTRVVSSRTAREVRVLMEAVMGEGGTGARLSIPGYRLAGKTGTAQRATARGYSGYTASFMGFAPADKPRVVVAVSLQDPRNGRYGGVLAGPVWEDVTSFALQRLHVPPTGAKAATVPLHPPR